MAQPSGPSVPPLSPERMERLIRAFPGSFNSLSPLEQRISIRIYRLLAAGQPVSREQLATELQLSNERVNTVLSQWPGAYYDEAERITGYWGLALTETKHRFEVDGRALYTWCAWDSLFIPELIAKTALVTSSCEVTGDALQLTVALDGPREIEPTNAVMSFVEPRKDKINEDIVGNFCHFVHFFSSPAAGMQWVADHPATFLMGVNDAYALGQRKNRMQYTEVL